MNLPLMMLPFFSAKESANAMDGASHSAIIKTRLRLIFITVILRNTSDLMMISFMKLFQSETRFRIISSGSAQTADATLVPNARHEAESVSKVGFQTIRM